MAVVFVVGVVLFLLFIRKANRKRFTIFHFCKTSIFQVSLCPEGHTNALIIYALPAICGFSGFPEQAAV